VTYFFDNTFPPQLAKIVAILGVDAVHLQDEFPPNTLDVTWIPEIGRHGSVVITADRGISKKPAERKALEEANVISVFMAKGFTMNPIFELVSLFVKWWPDIDRSVQRVKPGTSLQVNPNGKIDLL
jgi:hypothetical protein